MKPQEDYQLHPSGLIVPASAVRAPKPTAIDLFAGCGGMSCGFHRAGFHVFGASEWWATAAETYLCNLGSQTTSVYVGETAPPDATKAERAIFAKHGGHVVYAGELFKSAGAGWITQSERHPLSECMGGGDRRESFHETYCLGGRDFDVDPCEVFWMCDVTELRGADMCKALGVAVGDVDAVMGGPPCQGFSSAGKRNVMDARNRLVFEFARLVCEVKPRNMVMENVPGIMSMVTPEGVPVIDALCRILEQGEYAPYEAMRKALVGREEARVVPRGRGATSPAENSDQLAMAVAP